MKRRFFAVVSLFSLLLAVGTATLWANSHFRAYELVLNGNRGLWSLGIRKDGLEIDHTRECSSLVPDGWTFHGFPAPDDFNFARVSTHSFGLLGFGIYTSDRPSVPFHGTFLVIPFWFLAGCLMLIPATWLAVKLRKRAALREGGHGRRKRWLLSVVSLASLLLCAATGWIWMFGYGGDPAELSYFSYFGADRESAKSARYWHAHIGSHDGGIYWMWGAIQIIPVDREWELVGKREWHHGERLFGAIDSIVLDRRFGQLSPPQAGDPLVPRWLILGPRAFRFSGLGEKGYVVVIPDLWLLLLAAIAPTLWLRRRILQRRYRIAGRCLICGYDLTGNTSGICPECGTSIPQPAQTPAASGKGLRN